MALVAQYNGPLEGMDISMPQMLVSRQGAVYSNNFILRQNYIQTRPAFGPFPDLPIFPVTDPIYGIAVSLDTRGVGFVNYWLFVWAGTNVYCLMYSPSTDALSWISVGTPAAQVDFCFDWINTTVPALTTITPINADTGFGGTVFVNGSQEVYFIWTGGSINGGGFTGLTGGLYGARFVMELAQGLMIANTFETDAGTGTHNNYQQRIRWSAVGTIDVWDPTANVGAGFTDLLDCSDVITGTLSVGSIGYLLRVNGITQVSPTGNGLQPYNFNHLWASQMGIGQIFAQTRAQYGALAFLLAEDNVYRFTVSSVDTVGDKVIDEIVDDVYATDPTCNPYSPNFFASLTPKFAGDYRYLVYRINIADSGIVWNYDLTTKTWTKEHIQSRITAKPFYVNSNTNPIKANYIVPCGTLLYTYDVENFNSEMSGSYAFKVESQAELGYVSVGFVAVHYINLGPGNLTVTLMSPSYQSQQRVQTLTLGDPTKDKAYYNGGTPPQASADGVGYVAFFSFTPLTDEWFQIVLTRNPNDGPIKIVQISVFGEMKEEPR